MNTFDMFWDITKKGCKVKTYELRSFLIDNGFGRFKSTESRLEETRLFRNDNGVLKLHNANSVKRWVRNFIESIEQADFCRVFNDAEEESFKFDVLRMWQDFSETNLKTRVLDDLPEWSDEHYADKRLNLFTDTPDECFIRFQNGVVKITKDNVELLERDVIKEKGQVWESSIRKHNIKLDLKNTNGMFSKFFNRTMYRHKEDIDGIENWIDEYELNDSGREELHSLRTSYGYLIHDHNTADVSKLVFYIDENSELGRPEGGNGKSVVMESIQHYKKKAHQDGKRFRQNMDSDRFQFSNVELDTRFVFIDDITPEFHFEKLFSMITGDMEIEGKGTNKVIIPKDKKPKMGLTTNYVLAGTGTSYERRQHIVEFGSYWNRMNQEGESTRDEKHLGGLLFDWDKDSDEWNRFYNFGFKCVQDYLKYGLVASTNKSYLTKSIKLLVEGNDGSGQGTEWLMNWIKTERLGGDYHKTGISEKELYSHFVHDNTELVEDISGVWSFKFFSQALWDLVDNTKGWYYNQHKAKLGNTKTQRRWLAYDSEKIQVRFVKITTDFDKEWMTCPWLPIDNGDTAEMISKSQGISVEEAQEIIDKREIIDRSDGTSEWFKEYDEAVE
tara:strand:+ start:2 stop:1843 length:1842 start_codon:yes stop_codon:yes gene_type:complete